MGEVKYAPVILDMTWSYSRIKAFQDCPYRWYLRYIRRLPRKELFFASYGTFLHKLMELYYKGELTREQLCEVYLRDFKSRVVGHAPNQTVFENYFKSGLQYLRDFKPFPYHVIAVEKRVELPINGVPFVGYIDFLGEKDADLFVIDNKSRNLKPRSGRTKPTKSDRELDSYLLQLYLYSAAVEREYGKLPSALCFNCFRSQTCIKEPFRMTAYAEAKDWLSSNVAEITRETDFNPKIEYFKCRHLCEMQDQCEYYDL